MNNTNPKPFVFILMPFSQKFDDIYQVGIKPACKDSGAYCERVDEQIFDGIILHRIYNQIAKADIIISDMTGRNPNVFYETGYAHAIGKRVILLTQNEEDIPFDLKHYSHIVYGGKISILKKELERRIQWAIKYPKEDLSKVDFNLPLYIHGMEVIENIKVTCPAYTDQGTYTGVELNIDIYNPTSTIHDKYLRIGVIAPDIFYCSGRVISGIALPDGQSLYLCPPIETLYPQGWASISLELSSHDIRVRSKEIFKIIIRVFTELGTKDIPIRMDIDIKT